METGNEVAEVMCHVTWVRQVRQWVSLEWVVFRWLSGDEVLQ